MVQGSQCVEYRADFAGVLFFGFGGHARSVADVAMAMGVNALCFVDSNAQPGETLLEFPVVREWNKPLPSGWRVFSASGENKTRQRHFLLFESYGWELASLIAPTASIGTGSKIGSGSLIGHQAHIGPFSTIGTGCIINTGAVIEHECKIGDFAHISVNSTVAGRSQIGRFSMIGAGATVVDGIQVTEEVMVGAGGLVHRSILTSGVYVGMPVRKIR